MSHFDESISELQRQLKDQEAEVLRTKELINRLCQVAGRPILYGDAELKATSAVSVIRSDQYYGKPLAAAVREILEIRQRQLRPFWTWWL